MNKILVLTDKFPVDGDYKGIFVKRQVEWLRINGYHVNVISIMIKNFSEYKQGIGKFKYNKTQNGEIELILRGTSPIPRCTICIALFSIILTTFFLLYFRISSTKSIIISHFFIFSGITGSVIKKLFKSYKLIIFEHRKSFPTLREEKLQKYAIKSADMIILPSRYFAKWFVEKNHLSMEKICVGWNILSDVFLINNNLANQKKNIKSIIFVGNLIPLKRVDLLIKSFIHLYRIRSGNVSLKIIGDGPLIENLKNLSNGYPIDFLGTQEQQIIFRILIESDLMCHFSETETFGCSVAEALMVGLPVLVSDCGGPEEFINESNGKVSSEKDPELLAAIMNEMLNINYKKNDIAKDFNKKYNQESEFLLSIINK
jgi:glycosyltransferase involved in cell wall biosynthesis